jgi:hypothetical protein
LHAALLACLRNWVYLVCVAYKVARRLALLAFHGPLERLSGTLLTFLGMLLGLWQSLGYAALDMALDVALLKLQVGRQCLNSACTTGSDAPLLQLQCCSPRLLDVCIIQLAS